MDRTLSIFLGVSAKAADSNKIDGKTFADLLLSLHPIGCIYESTDSTSPETLFGGTWAAFGAGRVLVGIDSTQTEFDTIGKTGGEKTHTLRKPR